MAGRSTTCTFAKRRADTQRVEIRFGNRLLDFADAAEVGQFVDQAWTNPEDVLQAMLIRWARVNGTIARAEGKTITLDWSAADGAIVRIT